MPDYTVPPVGTWTPQQLIDLANSPGPNSFTGFAGGSTGQSALGYLSSQGADLYATSPTLGGGGGGGGGSFPIGTYFGPNGQHGPTAGNDPSMYIGGVIPGSPEYYVAIGAAPPGSSLYNNYFGGGTSTPPLQGGISATGSPSGSTTLGGGASNATATGGTNINTANPTFNNNPSFSSNVENNPTNNNQSSANISITNPPQLSPLPYPNTPNFTPSGPMNLQGPNIQPGANPMPVSTMPTLGGAPSGPNFIPMAGGGSSQPPNPQAAPAQAIPPSGGGGANPSDITPSPRGGGPISPGMLSGGVAQAGFAGGAPTGVSGMPMNPPPGPVQRYQQAGIPLTANRGDLLNRGQVSRPPRGSLLNAPATVPTPAPKSNYQQVQAAHAARPAGGGAAPSGGMVPPPPPGGMVPPPGAPGLMPESPMMDLGQNVAGEYNAQMTAEINRIDQEYGARQGAVVARFAAERARINADGVQGRQRLDAEVNESRNNLNNLQQMSVAANRYFDPGQQEYRTNMQRRAYQDGVRKAQQLGGGRSGAFMAPFQRGYSPQQMNQAWGQAEINHLESNMNGFIANQEKLIGTAEKRLEAAMKARTDFDTNQRQALSDVDTVEGRELNNLQTNRENSRRNIITGATRLAQTQVQAVKNAHQYEIDEEKNKIARYGIDQKYAAARERTAAVRDHWERFDATMADNATSTSQKAEAYTKLVNAEQQNWQDKLPAERARSIGSLYGGYAMVRQMMPAAEQTAMDAKIKQLSESVYGESPFKETARSEGSGRLLQKAANQMDKTDAHPYRLKRPAPDPDWIKTERDGDEIRIYRRGR